MNKEKEKQELLLGLVSVANKGQELIPHKDYEIKQDGDRFYLVKKKKGFPKTYEECLIELIGDNPSYDEKYQLLETFRELLICRNAYWKIAGEEMGLGKPWENSRCEVVYGICRDEGNIVKRDDYWGDTHIFEFPIREMRDAFFDNFKEEIEKCKELI